jgi:hypothetical protein
MHRKEEGKMGVHFFPFQPSIRIKGKEELSFASAFIPPPGRCRENKIKLLVSLGPKFSFIY